MEKECEFVEKLFRAAETGQVLPSRGSESGGDVCDLLVAPVGSEDPEREKGSSLQKLFSQITDDKKSQELRQYFVNTE